MLKFPKALINDLHKAFAWEAAHQRYKLREG